MQVVEVVSQKTRQMTRFMMASNRFVDARGPEFSDFSKDLPLAAQSPTRDLA